MTTLAELVAQSPSASWGVEVPLTYGAGTWRFAFMVADPRQGSSVEWHDLTGPVSSIEWSRGTSRPRGRYQATEPTVFINAQDDTYAPWNPDNSGVFGVHVPLRAGLLMRASVFRVNPTVNLHFPLFTARVRRWRDGQAAKGQYRYHRVDGIDLMSYLVQVPSTFQASEGWYDRIEDLLAAADWPFGEDIYGARTVDASTPVVMSDREASQSAISEIDATLDPAGLVWRTRPSGSLVAHPPPWDSFHAGFFASTATVVGDEWTPVIDTYYPGGPTFSYDATDGEVQFITEDTASSFGVDSDIENVANEWTITHPINPEVLDSGLTVSAYDDPVSAGYFGRRAIASSSWQTENDVVQQDLVDSFAYTDLSAAPLSVNVLHSEVFPAIAVLDHFDPCTIKHASKPGRLELTVSGPLRQITHSLRRYGNGILWDAQVQVDVDSEATSAALNPPHTLTVSNVTHQRAEFDWVNPSQTITPTEVQIRITQMSTQWISIPYGGVGADGRAWSGLPSSSFLTFEVRLVRRVDGLVTHVSSAAEISFVTAVAPVPTPDPDDPTDVIIPDIYDPECLVEWKVESTDDGTTWTLVDSGDENDPEVTDGVIDISGLTFDPSLTYRVCTREVCDMTPGSWSCSDSFAPHCPDPGLSGAYVHAITYVPKVCGADVFEAVSGIKGARGPAWGDFYPVGTDIAVSSGADAPGVVAYGSCNEHTPTSPATTSVTLSLGEPPADGEPLTLWAVHGLHIEALYDDATHWTARAKVFISSGGYITLTESGSLNLDTVYELRITHDTATGDVAFLIDESEISTLGSITSRANTLPVWQIQLPPDSWATHAAAWAVADFDNLPPSGLVFADSFATTDMNGGIGQLIPGTSLVAGGQRTTSPTGVLEVVDASDPTDLAAEGTTSASATLADIKFGAVHPGGDWFYEANSILDVVAVVDISTPASPSLGTSLTDATYLNSCRGVAASADWLVTAGLASDRVAFWSLASPGAPSFSHAATLNAASHVAICADSSAAFCWTTDGNLVSYNVSTGAVLDTLAVSNASAAANSDMQIYADKWLYLGGAYGAVVDVSNPSNMSIVQTGFAQALVFTSDTTAVHATVDGSHIRVRLYDCTDLAGTWTVIAEIAELDTESDNEAGFDLNGVNGARYDPLTDAVLLFTNLNAAAFLTTVQLTVV